ncbi:MAG: sialidase family protein, partial [bacterium]
MDVKPAKGGDSGLLMSGLIFPPTDRLPSNHGSSIYQMPDGTVMSAWYAASEGPRVIADTPGKSEGNPVLFADGGTTWLFYVTIHGLGWNWAKIKYRTSEDSGRTWSDVRILRNKRGWMTRNHPVKLSDGRILLPLYSENKWCSEFMESEDGHNWEHVAEVCSNPGNIQASVVELSPGNLYATMRTGDSWFKEKRVWETRSHDGGRTWTEPEQTALPNPNAGTDMIKMDSGKLLLAFNNSEDDRTPLSLAVSDDGGKTWEVVKDLETAPGEYSYPSLCKEEDGSIHISYTYKRESIK